MLSSQNPSYLSPIRKFTLTDGTQLGFYETKLSKNKTFSELQTIILNNLNILNVKNSKNFNKFKIIVIVCKYVLNVLLLIPKSKFVDNKVNNVFFI